MLICDKQRNGEWEGKIKLWFDRRSGQYMEDPECAPCDLMEYLP